jgi:chromosomal replication initiator protein
MDAALNAELEHIWSRVQAELAVSVDEPTYRIWLQPLRARRFAGGRLQIEAPPQACGWIHDRFGRLLQTSVVTVLGPDAVVDLVAGPGTGAWSPGVVRPPAAAITDARPGGRARHGAWLAPPGAGDPPDFPAAPDRVLAPDAGYGAGPADNPKLTFDQFVIGDSNRLAHAAALTVAELPAQAYNPLFICGPPGVGKTHLLNSIAALLLSHSPGLSVRCTTGEAFTNEFLHALGGGGTEAFKSRFRHVDVLLLDDVQFLERKTKTEEEFFHTFNALQDTGRQIVLTSDRPPADLQALEDRLRDRFGAGLVVDVKPPDLATRLAILRKRVHTDGIELADDLALTVIADSVEENVRVMEGALIRVVAYSSLTGRPLTGELTREVLASLYPGAHRGAGRSSCTVADIQLAACEYFGVTLDELLSPVRSPRLAWPRQVAMYLARELTSESLLAIGRQFGGRDHTTVLYAWRRINTRVGADEQTRRAVDKLFSELRQCER